MFASGIAGTRTLLDPFKGNQSTTIIRVRSGNENLVPEEADSTGIGLVLRPRFLPGFTASMDYYNIEISGAIGTISSPTIVNGCFDGISSYCANIVRDPVTDLITRVNSQPFNANSQTARGIDYEASYMRDLYGGNLSFRVLATNFFENSTDLADPTAVDFDTVGENRFRGPPDWRYRATVAYERGPSRFSLTGRGLSDGVYNNTYIECTSGCPTSTSAARTTDNNSIDGAFYLDGSWTYQFNDSSNVFLSVSNLLDRDPAGVPASQNIGNTPKGVNIVLYDLFGRVFRLGVRFEIN